MKDVVVPHVGIACGMHPCWMPVAGSGGWMSMVVGLLYIQKGTHKKKQKILHQNGLKL